MASQSLGYPPVDSQQETAVLSHSAEIKLTVFLRTPYVTLSEPPSFSGLSVLYNKEIELNKW